MNKKKNESEFTLESPIAMNQERLNIVKLERDLKPIEPDPREKRWELLPKVKLSLDDLLVKYPEGKQHRKIKKLQKDMEKMIELRDKINKQMDILKFEKVISLKERNVYLEKLREVEEYGENLDWKDESGMLSEISNLLYND